MLTAVAVWVPIDDGRAREFRGPLNAANRVEAEVGHLGLEWGPLRGWRRLGDGWELIWQPPHGAWLVRGWASDRGDEAVWRLEAAPWLPGARLSGHAAAFIAGTDSEWVVPRERTARRDWQVGDSRVVGSLPGGSRLPRPAGPQRLLLWEAMVAGMVLAGAAARLLVPPFRVAPWRNRILAGLAMLLLGLPWSLPLGARFLAVGVRPWVAQSAYLLTAASLAAVIALGSVRFSPSGGAPPAVLPCLAFPCGVMLGRTEILPWMLEVAVVPGRLLLWLGLVTVASWVIGLAGEGLRELTTSVSLVRRLLLLALAVPAVVFAGTWRGLVLGAVMAASVPRGQGTWVGLVVGWGWLAGLQWPVTADPAVSWQFYVFLLAGIAVALAVDAAGRRSYQDASL